MRESDDAAVTSPSQALSFEEALALYEGSDFAKALQGSRIHADQGNTRAQFTLGEMYFNGESVAKDDAQAARWVHLAVEQGHAAAQIYLARMYFAGRGVPADIVESHAWLDIAEAQAFPQASAKKKKRLRADVRNTDPGSTGTFSQMPVPLCRAFPVAVAEKLSSNHDLILYVDTG